MLCLINFRTWGTSEQNAKISPWFVFPVAPHSLNIEVDGKWVHFGLLTPGSRRNVADLIRVCFACGWKHSTVRQSCAKVSMYREVLPLMTAEMCLTVKGCEAWRCWKTVSQWKPFGDKVVVPKKGKFHLSSASRWYFFGFSQTANVFFVPPSCLHLKHFLVFK